MRPCFGLALGRLRVLGRQGHPRLPCEALHRLDEAEPLGLLQEGNDVAMLSGRKVMEKALVVIDEEGRRLLLGEGRQADILASLTLELHRPPDDVGRPKAGLQFFKEAIVEAHRAL